MSQSLRLSVPLAWRAPLAALLALWAWIIFLYWDTGVGIVSIWIRSETFNHCFIVPPISAWLVWRRRHELAAHIPRPSPVLLAMLALAGFAWLLGDLSAVNALTQLALVTLLVLVVVAVLGFKVAKLILFPLAFLFFAVPIGEFVMPQFMEWTADFTVSALRLTGIPVYREGLQFVIPSGNWSVVEACSGVRYLIASVTVGTLFAYLNYRSLKRRLMFVAVSILVPVLANWMRAYMIVMLGHLSGNKLATGVDHIIYGWVFFGVVIMLMFFVGARWAEPDAVPEVAPDMAQGGLSAAGPGRFAWVALATMLVVALPLMGRLAIAQGDSAATPQLALPTALSGGWQQAVAEPPPWTPAFANTAAQGNALYRLAGQEVGLYLGYYRHQSVESKLVSSENVLVRSQDTQWAQVSSGSHGMAWQQQQAMWRTGELRSLGQTAEARLNVWRIYWVNGTLTSSDALAKAYGAWYRLLGRGDDAAVVIVYTRKTAGEAGDSVLEAFLQANGVVVQQVLERTRARR